MAAVEFVIQERVPSVREHRFLWESVGWGDLNTEMSEGSLEHSLYGVVATVGGEPAGMGRVVGDGFMFFYIQDVAVLPAFQGHGIGKEIIRYLLAYIENRRVPGGKAFVGLFAAEGKTGFYEKLGLCNHAPHMTGMCTVLEK